MIGAMLVAPLMSPIAGLSLASVAGERRMFETRDCIRPQTTHLPSFQTSGPEAWGHKDSSEHLSPLERSGFALGGPIEGGAPGLLGPAASQDRLAHAPATIQ